MPYPFCPATRWGGFLGGLAQQGVHLALDPVMVPEEDGTPTPVRVLVRDGFDPYPAIYASLDEQVTPTVIRSTCAAFGIDPGIFGFTIG